MCPVLGKREMRGNLKERDHLEDLSVDGEGIMDLKETRYRA
jgi:hypothetical protein